MCVHNYYFLLCCFLAVRMAADLPLSKANNCTVKVLCVSVIHKKGRFLSHVFIN